ncbi:ABC transporter G family member 31-like [Actinidia eriantha]|uniref:ABC transporter G family member 31-like n=1 Tax=Actinidia eriantha TaxID=165200 RepID=UPI00258AEFD0|nr:ABC transporter G family member 31-like [Actinidia eriantha]
MTANVQVGLRTLPTPVNHFRYHFERVLTGLHIFRPKRHHLTILNDINGFVTRKVIERFSLTMVFGCSKMTLLLGPPSLEKSTLVLTLVGKLDPGLKVSVHKAIDQRERERAWRLRTGGNGDDRASVECRVGGEDEDEILWAALARLPSQKRTNFALLRRTASESDSGEERTETVDVRKLDLSIASSSSSEHWLLQSKTTTSSSPPSKNASIEASNLNVGSRMVIMGFLQCMKLGPKPEAFDLSDDLVLLSNAYLVYQGPQERVLEFFGSLGFQLPSRKGVTDFLQEVFSLYVHTLFNTPNGPESLSDDGYSCT